MGFTCVFERTYFQVDQSIYVITLPHMPRTIAVCLPSRLCQACLALLQSANGTYSSAKVEAVAGHNRLIKPWEAARRQIRGATGRVYRDGMGWKKRERQIAGRDRKRTEEIKVQRMGAPFPHRSLVHTRMHARTHLPSPALVTHAQPPFPTPWPACLVCAPHMAHRSLNNRPSHHVKVSWADIARPATPFISFVNHVAAHQGQDARGCCRCKAAGT
jgi:hypothetical protein